MPDDINAVHMYEWTILTRNGDRMRANIATDVTKRSIFDYHRGSQMLLFDMKNYGFNPAHPIPIDPNGDILDGSHRVACALELGIDKIPTVQMDRDAWAPEWDKDWFVFHRMPDMWFQNLMMEYEKINGNG